MRRPAAEQAAVFGLFVLVVVATPLLALLDVAPAWAPGVWMLVAAIGFGIYVQWAVEPVDGRPLRRRSTLDPYWRGMVESGYLTEAQVPAARRYFDEDLAYSRSEAVRRAQKLLEENLDKKQMRTWRDQGYFAAVGGRTGKTYHIHASGAVYSHRSYHCIVPHTMFQVVSVDAVLMRKLLIEQHEDYFRATAKRSAAMSYAID